MKVLVVNAGSTSVKFKLYDMADQSVVAEGNCQRVGLKDSEIKYVDTAGKKFLFTEDLANHNAAFAKIMALLTDGETKVIGSIGEIDAVGHRVSMGGPKYVKTVFADESVLAEADALSDITPLHNPPQVNAIRACKEVFGDAIPMTVGFDTAFHQTMPETSYIYPIPYEYYEKYHVRRFGFHGLSYQFVTDRYAELTGNPLDNHCMVVCHLGGGASATAIKNGKSMDNTFGFGTGQGLLCGSRAGSFDHVAVGYIMSKTGMTYEEAEEMLHKQSGLLGISGISSDEREIEDAAAQGNKRAQLALDVMAQQVKKYIGAYAFEMGGLDTLVFTGGIGENSDIMRAMVCDGLEAFGIRMDKGLNVEKNRSEANISAADSTVDVWIIPTNEELVIAQDTVKLIAAAGK
ncbi:acetate/propionate family kinase [Ruminococcaceae bacterium OttesenSCG-928-L11]|nr:acetate/propionate family kinase [Ruminococcaceae bacterium OttesenSCG-928-L11]